MNNKMIRSSKHILKYQTNYKTNMLGQIFEDYEIMLNYYIDLILCGELEYKRSGLSSKLLPKYKFSNSAWRQIVYDNAISIIESQRKKANRRRYKKYKQLYAKCKERNKCKWFTNRKFSELYLKPIYRTKYFIKPKINNIRLTLNQRVVNLSVGNHFDEFIQIRTPYFKNNKKRSITINLPIKHHRHSNKFNDWDRKNSILLYKKNEKYFIDFIYEKQIPKPNDGYIIGIDQGYKKLLTTSSEEYVGEYLENLYNEISNKKQGSKEFKRKLIQRDNLINYYCNKLDLNDVGEIVIEDLKNVKHGSKQNKKKIHKNFMNKLQRWSYRKTTDKLERLCEENGILLTKVNPAYTSQTCSYCGYIDKNSRKGENFSCQYCGSNLDVDLNAAINLSHMGAYSPHIPKNKIKLGG